MIPAFHIEQRVRVYPRSRLLRRYTGWCGMVDSVELDDDERTLLYRIKLDDEAGQGYPYFELEVKAVSP